jgi:hypothetical protein
VTSPLLLSPPSNFPTSIASPRTPRAPTVAHCQAPPLTLLGFKQLPPCRHGLAAAVSGRATATNRCVVSLITSPCHLLPTSAVHHRCRQGHGCEGFRVQGPSSYFQGYICEA